MIAGPRHTLHFTSAARDHGSHLDDVAVLEQCVAGHECPVGDDEMRLTVQLQTIEQNADADRPGDLNFAPWISKEDLQRVGPFTRFAGHGGARVGSLEGAPR